MGEIEQKVQSIDHKMTVVEGLCADLRRDMDDLSKSQERVAIALTGSIEHDKPGVLTNVREHTKRLDDLLVQLTAIRAEIAEVKKLASDGPSTQEFKDVKDVQAKQGSWIEKMVIYGALVAIAAKMLWDYYLASKK